jgi:hypothetical protein
MDEPLRRAWSHSKTFRVVLIVVSIYAMLRLTIQFLYWTGMVSGGVGQVATSLPADFQTYVDAAQHFQLRQNLYPERRSQTDLSFYEYPPSYALAFTPFLWLPAGLIIPLCALLHLAAYVLLYIWWGRIFRRLGLHRAEETLAWALPVWMIFTPFWFDLSFLNNYVIMALLATLLIEAVLEERLGWSLVWLSLIVQIKPQWAFAAALPLFLGRWRFFLKLLALSIVVYAGVIGVTMLVGGPGYGLQQYKSYFLQLVDYANVFPWRGPEAKYLGYSHSILQIVFYLFGVTSNVRWLAWGIKTLFLAPLAILWLRSVLRPASRTLQSNLELVLVLYLGTFIWLDVVVELFLGIVVFTYLLATLERRGAKILVWAVFLPYALDDFFQLAGYAIFGERIFFKDAIIGDVTLSSPGLYVPTTMIVILTFYALLVRRLWIGWHSTTQKMARPYEGEPFLNEPVSSAGNVG